MKPERPIDMWVRGDGFAGVIPRAVYDAEEVRSVYGDAAADAANAEMSAPSKVVYVAKESQTPGATTVALSAVRALPAEERLKVLELFCVACGHALDQPTDLCPTCRMPLGVM